MIRALIEVLWLPVVVVLAVTASTIFHPTAENLTFWVVMIGLTLIAVGINTRFHLAHLRWRVSELEQQLSRYQSLPHP
jgi:hypothetical protein